MITETLPVPSALCTTLCNNKGYESCTKENKVARRRSPLFEGEEEVGWLEKGILVLAIPAIEEVTNGGQPGGWEEVRGHIPPL